MPLNQGPGLSWAHWAGLPVTTTSIGCHDNAAFTRPTRQVDLFFLFSVAYRANWCSNPGMLLLNNKLSEIPRPHEKMGNNDTDSLPHAGSRTPLLGRRVRGAQRQRDLRFPGRTMVDSFLPGTLFWGQTCYQSSPGVSNCPVALVIALGSFP